MAANINDSISVVNIPSNKVETVPPFINDALGFIPADFWNWIFHGVTRYVLIIFLVVYLVIAILTIKQIGLMTQTINTGSNKMILFLGYIHLFAVLVCLLYTLFVI